MADLRFAAIFIVAVFAAGCASSGAVLINLSR